ncbi:MAG: hypothetical protein HGA67_04315 [Candidatus Yonathbacteria bacterium]|nr:hypothetical protein [Candidatus Yonathbacteria bacterium]
METLIVVLIALWIIGMGLDTVKFVELWRTHGYRLSDMEKFLSTPIGKDVIKDFPVFGRALFSLALIVLMYGMTFSILLTGTLFIVGMGIVHNLCSCSRKRYPYPNAYSTRLGAVVTLSVILELALFVIFSRYVFTLYPSFAELYTILLLSSLRFAISSTAVFIVITAAQMAKPKKH